MEGENKHIPKEESLGKEKKTWEMKSYPDREEFSSEEAWKEAQTLHLDYSGDSDDPEENNKKEERNEKNKEELEERMKKNLNKPEMQFLNEIFCIDGGEYLFYKEDSFKDKLGHDWREMIERILKGRSSEGFEIPDMSFYEVSETTEEWLLALKHYEKEAKEYKSKMNDSMACSFGREYEEIGKNLAFKISYKYNRTKFYNKEEILKQFKAKLEELKQEK